MSNTHKKIVSLVLALTMILALAACGGTAATEPAKDTPATETTTEATPAPPADTLVVGYSPFNEKFSPFFSETAYDTDVAGMTQIVLLKNDRQGAIIYKGIEGETINYNGTDYTYYGPADCVVTENEDGTVFYDFTLRDDIVFSDGTPLTIDDVIFNMYVLSDPTYDGSSTFFALKIDGMEAYRSGMESRQKLILAAGPDGYKETEFFTEDQYVTFWEAFQTAGENFCQSIVDYCLENYADYGAVDFASSAALWGYEGVNDPAEFWEAMIATYGYDISDEGINAEVASTGISSFIAEALGDRANEFAAGVQTGESAPNISGIQRTGDNSLRVVLTEVDATAIYQLGITVAPMSYYGDPALYDYENNSFGFPKGDLSSVRAGTTRPVGAGPYKFVEFKDGVVYFEANDAYYLGAPKTKYVNFQQCVADDDKLNGVVTGTIDITDPSFSTETVSAIQSANGG